MSSWLTALCFGHGQTLCRFTVCCYFRILFMFWTQRRRLVRLCKIPGGALHILLIGPHLQTMTSHSSILMASRLRNCILLPCRTILYPSHRSPPPLWGQFAQPRI